MPLTRLLVVTSLLAGLAGVARAEDGAVDPAVRNYHLQIAATDVVAAGAFFGGNALESESNPTGDVLMAGGGLTYALGGPLVHVAHRNYGRAAISVGLRVLLPIVGANVGVAFSSCDRGKDFGSLCYLDDMAAGFLVGSDRRQPAGHALDHARRGDHRAPGGARDAVAVAVAPDRGHAGPRGVRPGRQVLTVR